MACEFEKFGGCGSERTPHPVTEVFILEDGAIIFKYENGSVHSTDAKLGSCELCESTFFVRVVGAVYGDGTARCKRHLK